HLIATKELSTLSLHDALPIYEHERAGLSSAPQEGGRSLEEAEACALRLDRLWLGEVGEKLAQLGKQLGEIGRARTELRAQRRRLDRKSTRLNSSHGSISYAVF